jgi:hypothetical protein
MAESLVVELNPTHIEAEPGAMPIPATLTLHNRGLVVEQFTAEVVGLDKDWYTVPVPSVGLFPGDKEQLSITFHPPRRTGMEAGSYPFRVLVRARGGTDEEVVDGSLDVRGFAVYRLDLMPRRQTGRGTGRYRVQLTNSGTADVHLALEASDAEEACRIKFNKDDTPLVAAGSKAEVPISVTPKRRPWVGAPRAYEFTVVARPQDARGEPQTVSGQYTHKPFMASWSPMRNLAWFMMFFFVLFVIWNVAMATGVVAEFPRRMQTASGVVGAGFCRLPLLGRLCRQPTLAAQPLAVQSPECVFELGFREYVDQRPDAVGDCTENASYDVLGNALQHTEHGTLMWFKATNVVYFYDGQRLDWLPTAFPESCEFQFGFRDAVTAQRSLVGECLTNAAYDQLGNGYQQTSNGTLFWLKSANALYFLGRDQVYRLLDGQTVPVTGIGNP